MRRLLAAATALVLSSTVAPAAATEGPSPVPPVRSAAAPTPGAFTGYAFDARCAPTQEQMDAWLTGSPFWGVGIYLGGSMMSCGSELGETGQPHLDAEWVARQGAAGWRLLPIWVGPQASCSGYADRIDPDPGDTGKYPAAEARGRSEAAAAVDRARELGIPAGSTLWYDLEDFPLSEDHCRRSALRFLSGWTAALHDLGHRSGVYSNIAAGVHALDYADEVSPGSYEMPDQVWFAWERTDKEPHVEGDTKWLRATSWAGERIHQYDLDELATYGGVTLSIDRNYLVVGGGSVAPPERRPCRKVKIDLGDYPSLSRGRSGAAVRALQCLLKEHARYRDRLDGRFDRGVARAVKRFQRRVDHRTTGRVTARTWTALLARGEGAPLLKEGSSGDAVRHLQRALDAATPGGLRASGVLDRATARRLEGYQRSLGLPAGTGVVGPETWTALRRGRVPAR